MKFEEMARSIEEMDRELVPVPGRGNVPPDSAIRIRNILQQALSNDDNISFKEKQILVGKLLPTVNRVLGKLQETIEGKLWNLPEVHVPEAADAKGALEGLEEILHIHKTDINEESNTGKLYEALDKFRQALFHVYVGLESEKEEENFNADLEELIELQDRVFDNYIAAIQVIDKDYFPEAQSGESSSASVREESAEEEEGELDGELEEESHNVGRGRPGL